MSGECDYRYGFQARFLAQQGQDLEAVFITQVDIQQDQANIVAAGGFYGAAQPLSGYNSNSYGVQAPRHQLDNAGLVVDDQDAFHATGPRMASTLRVRAMGEKGLVK
jgi:hypothetical protein